MRAAYLAQVQAEVPALIGAVGAVTEGAGVQALRERVHKLRGSAGFYGYPEIGNVSAALEDWLVAVRDQEAAFSAAELQRLTEQLLAAIDAAQPPPTDPAA